jgi:hypothetical protein
MGENEKASQKKSKLCTCGVRPLTPLLKPIKKWSDERHAWRIMGLVH